MTPVYPIESEALALRDADNPLRWIYRVEPLAAAVAILLMLPLAIAIGIAIFAASRRSPLIRHMRVGWRGSPLAMLKFRTMWNHDSPSQRPALVEDISDSIPHNKAAKDARINSGLAAWCRRYSLDEIPQLYHILRGEMSFVGPRPITSSELDKYYGSSRSEVLALRPGLTGLWQVMGRNRLTYARRRRLDVLLVRRISPALYLRILLRTIPKVVGGYGAY